MNETARWTKLTDLLSQVSAEFTAIVDEHLGFDWTDNAEILALTTLRLHPAPTTRQITERSGLNRRAVSRLVNRLSDDGLVHIDSSPGDRRAVTVTLTGQGRARYDALAHALDVYFDTAADTAGQIVALLRCGPTPQTAPRPDALTVLESLAMAGSQLVAAVAAGERPAVLAGRQRAALLQIVTGNVVRPVDLTARLAANAPTVTYVINQLVDKGLVVRQSGTGDDRRAVILIATDTGHQYVRHFYEALAASTPALCRTFSPLAPSGLGQQMSPRTGSA